MRAHLNREAVFAFDKKSHISHYAIRECGHFETAKRFLHLHFKPRSGFVLYVKDFDITLCLFIEIYQTSFILGIFFILYVSLSLDTVGFRGCYGFCDFRYFKPYFVRLYAP